MTGFPRALRPRKAISRAEQVMAKAASGARAMLADALVQGSAEVSPPSGEHLQASGNVQLPPEPLFGPWLVQHPHCPSTFKHTRSHCMTKSPGAEAHEATGP